MMEFAEDRGGHRALLTGSASEIRVIRG